ncbi:MAG: TIGR03032 family protein [Arenicella sp.]|nr:TIGR03032 family protein [Arenicella sp.]
MSEIPASQYTKTFSELLNKAKLSLAVTTYQAKKLVLLRAQGEQINTHFIDMDRPMGLAFQNGRLSVGSGNTIVDYFNSANAAAKLESATHHDAVFLHRRTHVTGDIDVHEMAFDDGGELWLINTKMSCLCTLDVNYSFVPKWKPPFISKYDSTDRCHLNGLAMRDGKPRYVTALGVSDEAAGWRTNKASGGIVMDIKSDKIIADGLSMPHSPRWYKDRLFVLESGAGRLLTIDLQTGHKTTVAEVPGFCRGIDFIGRYAVIGLSQIRETAMFAGLPLTKRKEDRRCGVWIVDLVSGESAGYLSFNTGIEEIFSVQVLPMSYPTLLGLDSTLLGSSYSVPASAIEHFVSAKPQQIESDKAREYHQRGDHENAIELYKGILECDPDNIDTLYNLGHALSKSGQWDDAIDYIDQVIVIQPEHAQAWNVRGHFFANKQQFLTAIDNYNTAIAIDQQYASAHYHKACAQLSNGDYVSGLAGYQWRTLMPGFKQINLPHPRWQGEDISEKTLLVVTEPNAEDSILFSRYLALAKGKCERLIVVCDEPLITLFEEFDCVDEVRQHGQLPSELFDVYTMIGYLGAFFSTEASLNSTPSCYLKTAKTATKKQIIGNHEFAKDRAKIGIVWSSARANHSNSGFTIEDFLLLVSIPDADFYSFQQGTSEQERAILAEQNVINLESEMSSFHQTSRFLENMDYVICVPCTVAHLAGALDVTALLVTTDHDDWRWAENKSISRWYPSTRVMRAKSRQPPTVLIQQCKDLICDKIRQQAGTA